MKIIISTLMTGALAATMLAGIPGINSTDMLASAQAAVSSANTHQIATVLELYYSDHGSYPDVHGGPALMSLLANEGYIEDNPSTSTDFAYEATNGGENYTLINP